MSATHRQPTVPLTDDERAVRKRGADLCRRRPDHFAAVARYADELQATGVDYHEAHRIALDRYDEVTAQGEG